MPCYSRIVATKMTDRERIKDAMKALKFRVRENGDFIFGTSPSGLELSFRRAGTSYSYDGNDQSLPIIARKYAEIGVREFARRRGFSVIDANSKQLTLVNRRG